MLKEMKSARGGKKLLVIIITAFLVPLAQNLHSQDDPAKVEFNKNAILKVTDMINTGDFTGLDKYIDANYTEHSPTLTQKPGIQGFIDAMKEFRASFPDIKITITDLVVTETKASWLSVMTGTNSGPLNGMPATNKKINVTGADWINIKDGKCVDHWGYIDDFAFMQQLGLNK